MTFADRVAKHKWKVVQFIVYILIFVYVYSKLLGGHLYQKIMNDWQKYRKNPFFIPIAGFFKRPDSKLSTTEATGHHFSSYLWTLIKTFFHYLMATVRFSGIA